MTFVKPRFSFHPNSLRLPAGRTCDSQPLSGAVCSPASCWWGLEGQPSLAWGVRGSGTYLGPVVIDLVLARPRQASTEGGECTPEGKEDAVRCTRQGAARNRKGGRSLLTEAVLGLCGMSKKPLVFSLGSKKKIEQFTFQKAQA